MTIRNALPNVFTIGNLFCGYLSIVETYNGNFMLAAVLILAASFFDAFDGKIARWVNSASDFGAELDSICDVVSFGLAPSILIYRFEFLDPPYGMPEFLAIAIAFLPAMGGALRLARFNVLMKGKKEHKKYFVGMPIPAAANTIGAYILFSGRLYEGPIMRALVPVMVIAIAGLMVSRVRYDSLPKLTWNQNNAERAKVAILIIGIVLFATLREAAFFPIMFFYLLSGLVRTVFDFFRHAEPSAGGATT